MHGLKSFGTAAITLAGVELAHRIHKRQFDLPAGSPAERLSLKESWRCALSEWSEPGTSSMSDGPPMHQISATSTSNQARRQGVPAVGISRRDFPMETGCIEVAAGGGFCHWASIRSLTRRQPGFATPRQC